MIFKEITKKDSFEYIVKTWYGEITITSKDKLDATILDTSFITIIKNGKSKGSFRYKDTDKEIDICYNWKKGNQWDIKEKNE